ncbi:hypothetical protein [Oceanobacillus iheyensis HTE831]|uniref:Uncharacterized protein n=1 Tax=Oceanobacillus iheyensis (strain DSM 14371 / CIP 107618 / JCM 11309 / KCTC 3954 / HTE831) TaxID=221109 RepID=Q8EMW5_OCEIH|nr:hypothetical protein [Oceanobacillus iheyensis]BAC14681.1 hypothetical protein [Oceanobacillus iheyensis HTE831]
MIEMKDGDSNGKARAEDPLGKVYLFSKLTDAGPVESVRLQWKSNSTIYV